MDFETTFFSEPKIIGKDQMLTANLASGEKVFMRISRFPEFHYGNSVRITGTLKKLMLNNKQVISTIQKPTINLMKNEQKLLFLNIKSPLAVISFVRQKMISLFQKTLPNDYSALLLGIVFGIKDQMSKDFENAVRISGISHVIVASGMNVAIVAGFLTSIFLIFLKRQTALIFSILGIIFYAFLSGLEPSIIRASIMGGISFSAQILGRQRLAFYLLFLTGYIMLFINPYIISDIGFQLSFLATFGLLSIKPLIDRNLFVKSVGKKIVVADDFTTTFSAQAATLPIILLNFGYFSLWSIAVNLLVLWTVPILMFFGGVGAITGIIFEPLGKLFLYLSLPFLIYFEKVVMFFSRFSTINIENLPWQFAVSYYLFLLVIIFYFKRKE